MNLFFFNVYRKVWLNSIEVVVICLCQVNFNDIHYELIIATLVWHSGPLPSVFCWFGKGTGAFLCEMPVNLIGKKINPL